MLRENQFLLFSGGDGDGGEGEEGRNFETWLKTNEKLYTFIYLYIKYINILSYFIFIYEN